MGGKVGGALLSAAVSAGIAFITTGNPYVAAAVFVISFAFAMIAQALAPEPEVPDFGDFGAFAGEQRERLQQIRQPITEWKIVYGYQRISGPLTFIETTESNKFLHMVITVASHPIEKIFMYQFNDEFIYPDDLDVNDVVQTGTYANVVKLQADLGTSGTQPFPDLEADVTDWSATHRQDGHTKLYVRLEFNKDVFTSIPKISIWCLGKNDILDTRTSTSGFTTNSALCVHDYMTIPVNEGGMGVVATEVDATFLNAAANTCDEIVATVAIDVEVSTVDDTNDILEFAINHLGLQTGDEVELLTTGVAPAGLAVSTSYYAILHEIRNIDPDAPIVRMKLAASLADSMSSTQIDITDGGTGTHTIRKTGEPRYTVGGVVDTAKTPATILDNLRSSMMGFVIPVGGAWKIHAGAFSSPTLTFDEGDLRENFSYSTKISRRERFNAVKGVYASPLNDFQPSDYPIVTNAFYQAADNDEQIFKELNLPFTTRPHTAQRIAKIFLEKIRQEITIETQFSLAALQVQAGETCMITNANAGFSAKTFEIQSWGIEAKDSEDSPELVVKMTLRETASEVFDWNSGEETKTDPAPDTTFPSARNPAPPGQITPTEQLYNSREGAGVKAKVILAWIATIDGFLEEYQAEFKLSADSTWTVVGRSDTETIEILDIIPGEYDFRVKSLNIFGVSSIYSTITMQQINGLLAPPNAPQNLTANRIGGMAIIRWDQSTDLDVRVGGHIVFRHDQLQTTAADWQTATNIGDAVSGDQTVAVLPFKPGTYLAKAIDSENVRSTGFGTISAKDATLLAFVGLSTISEHPSFSGTHNGTLVDASALQLGKSFDLIPDVDAVPDFDLSGEAASSGFYEFATNMDLGSVTKVRLRTSITVAAANPSDLIDSRAALIDTWADVDGGQGADVDAQVFVRETDSDPASSGSTFSAWQRLESAEFDSRGFQFQARLTNNDPSFNILVSELTIHAERVTTT